MGGAPAGALATHWGLGGAPDAALPKTGLMLMAACSIVLPLVLVWPRKPPMEHGGWGYRGSLRLTQRAAVVVRSGLALRLELQGGKRLSITVDDAGTAARLINGFVNRRTDPTADTAAAAVAQPS